LLRCEDLEHEGARLFFQNVDASTVVRDAVVAVFEHLYTHQTVPTRYARLSVGPASNPP
jgi:hypothetical protein